MAYFNDYSQSQKVGLIKKDYIAYIRLLFDDPSQLKTLITEKKITAENAKSILQKINELNAKPCACCRMFDQTKLQMGPIDPELNPLLDIVQQVALKKYY